MTVTGDVVSMDTVVVVVVEGNALVVGASVLVDDSGCVGGSVLVDDGAPAVVCVLGG